jgi:ATP-dependent RNA helicase DDX46/PRP5
MASSDSESSSHNLRKKHKKRDRKISRSRREKSRSRGKDKSRSRSRHRDRKDKKRRHRSRSRDSSISSRSSTRKNKNKIKKSDDRKRKYHDEIDELKDKERLKKLEVENKRKEEDKRKKHDEEKREEAKEILTEEEKLKRKRQSRLSKAIAVALLESADEKKNEVLKNDDLEDFLMDREKKKDFFIVDELEKFEEIAQVELENTQKMKIPEEKDNLPQVEIQIKSETTETTKLNEPINLTFSTFGTINKKLPQLPKEFLSLPKSQNSSVFNQNIPVKKPHEIPVSKIEEEEDPLDAFMKIIEKDAVIQDYELVQMMNRQQLQRQYDEITEKADTVKMIDEEMEYDYERNLNVDSSKIITLDDIMKKNKDLRNLPADVEMDKEITATSDENQDDFHKKFVETLMQTKAPEFDPIMGYTYIDEEKKENIMYQEDANEFLKEEDFIDTEEAWIRAKKSGEKAKELKLVNHSLIKYEDFTKNLYKETKEISNMSEEEVVNYRKEHGDIKVRGKNIPKPIFNWYQCGLSEKIISVLEKKGYKNPFPIQSQAVPTIMSGRDMIGIAETGSGKTLAFVLPMLRHVLDQRPLKDGEGPISLVFAPTRELATQIFSVLKSFCKFLNLKISCVYGGSGIGPQISELKRGAEIVVCTPGRMIEILCMNNGRITNLQRVRKIMFRNKFFNLNFRFLMLL